MSDQRKKIVLAALFLVTFMTAIEGTIVTTAMPTIIGELHGIKVMNWVFSIYLLTTAMSTPLYGKLAERLGRKKAFYLGIFLFSLGSFLSGISSSMASLIIARALQGFGAGSMFPLSMIIIIDLFEIEKRAKLMGASGGIWGIAGLLGPFLGGVIVQYLSWHWIFFINLPIACLAFFMISLGLKEEVSFHKDKPMDFLGAIILMLLVLSFMLNIQLIGDCALSLATLIIFMIFLFVSFLFIKVERKAHDPIMHLELFKNRNFMIYNVISFILNGFLIALDVYIPVWLQVIDGKSPVFAGAVIVPESFLWIYGSFVAPKIFKRIGLWKTIVLGSLMSLCLVAVIVFFPKTPPLFFFIILGACHGFVLGVTFTTFTIGVQQSVTKEHIEEAMSVNSLVRIGGNTVMIAVYGVILNTFMRLFMIKGANLNMMNKLMDRKALHLVPQNLLEPLRELLYQGIRIVFITVFLILLVNLILMVAFRTPDYFEEMEDKNA
jgi:EmrB/QacA subfamily drug resistance transporter